MLLENLNNSRCVLIKDYNEINVLPLLLESLKIASRGVQVATICYNQPLKRYRNKLPVDVTSYNDNPADLCKVNRTTAVLIDSFNQMLLNMGAQESFSFVRSCLCNAKIIKLIIIIHSDCEMQLTKLETQLEYFTHLSVTPIRDLCNKLRIYSRQKKGAKIFNDVEDLTYDLKEGFITSRVLTEKDDQDDSKILPHSLTTFKIGLESKEILARDALQLPYLNKQNPGQVHYEHDAADDWDDEDPDEDLDI